MNISLFDVVGPVMIGRRRHTHGVRQSLQEPPDLYTAKILTRLSSVSAVLLRRHTEGILRILPLLPVLWE